MTDDDISPMIEAKSDQLNAEDLMGGPRTIRVRDVKLLGKREQQPCLIYYDGDDNKPFKPCLTMRRLLAKVWGPRTSKWIGRSMTIYNEPTVKWAGAEVGGIRISHVSDIAQPVKLALAESKGKRRPTTVRPLETGQGAAPQQEPDRAMRVTAELIERIKASDDPVSITQEPTVIEQRNWLEAKRPELAQDVTDALAQRQRALKAEPELTQDNMGREDDVGDFDGGDDDIPAGDDDGYEGA